MRDLLSNIYTFSQISIPERLRKAGDGTIGCLTHERQSPPNGWIVKP